MRRADYEKILIKGANWVGDAILTTPAVRAIKEGFPKSHLAILTKSHLACLFKNNPYLDEIIPYREKEGLGKVIDQWKVAKRIREKDFNLAILFPNSFSSALTVFLAGIPTRAGYKTDGRGILLTHGIDKKEVKLTEHQIEYYLDIVRSLGIDAPTIPPEVWVGGDNKRWAEDFLALGGLPPSSQKTLVGLNPGAIYGSAKRWFPERYVKLANELLRNFDLEIILFGGPGEVDLVNSIASGIEGRVINAAGRTSLLQLAALIERCSLFVTNDTGPMHLAVAVKTPVVAIFGPTDFINTAPFGDGHTIVRKKVECSPCLKRECPTDHRCMDLVTVSDVFRAVKSKFELKG